MVKKLVLCAALAGLSVAAQAYPIDPYTGEVNPIAGATIVATGGHVIATYVSGGGYYDDYLYLAGPAGAFTNGSTTTIGANWIFLNRTSSSGNTVDLGYFAAGTVLTFNILADTHGTDCSQNNSCYLNWYSGPAGLNPDNQAHAIVDAGYTGPYGGTFVGFEDCFNCGGTGYYEDLRYTFSNVTSRVPEPASLFLTGIGLMGLGVSRKRFTRKKSAR